MYQLIESKLKCLKSVWIFLFASIFYAKLFKCNILKEKGERKFIKIPVFFQTHAYLLYIRKNN